MTLTTSQRKSRSLTYSYPNPILEYCSAIRSGSEVVSRKVRVVYEKLERIILNPAGRWIYDEHKANHAITFIERYCRHSKGKWGGKPVVLELWQRAFVAAMFGFVDKDTGFRKHTKTLLIVARKNGKSTLAAAIGLYLQTADGEAGPEVYAVATKKDQAKIIWLEARRMVRKSQALRRKLKCLVGEIVGEYNDSFFKYLGSDSDTLDGLNPHGALADEIHAWKDQNLHDVIIDGMTARDQPMFLETTTAGTVREAVYDTEYETASKSIDGVDGFDDERLLAVIYELDRRSEWTNPDMWRKANPGLGTIKDREALAAKVRRAIANPMLQKNLLCKDFNVRETTSEAWLTFEQLNNDAEFELTPEGLVPYSWRQLSDERRERVAGPILPRPRYGIGGTDLSTTTDLTAAKAIFMLQDDPTIYTMSMYWIPEDLLERRVREDKIPYDKWHEQGLLRTTPGNKVNPRFVTEWFVEVQSVQDIYLPWIGYDSWSSTMWADEMRGIFGKESMIPIIQGKKTLSAPMKSLGADLEAKILNYNNNPIDKWCLSNTAIEMDKNLNIQPCKTKNQRQRIDGTAALLDAYVVLQDRYNDYLSMI